MVAESPDLKQDGDAGVQRPWSLTPEQALRLLEWAFQERDDYAGEGEPTEASGSLRR